MDSVEFTSEPAPEVLRFFRNKGLRPSFSWRDVWGEEHAHAFTVAKAMQLDVLTSLRDGVDSAIAEGKTFEQFREELEPTLRKKGWWGRKTMTDPATGKPVKARLGSPRRLKIVYESNIRSANAAGTWDRAQRAKELLPYFRYELGPSLKHRPHHVAREGMTYPVDHPIWNEWYPPNGWGCKCWLRQIMEEEAIEAGWADAPEPDIPRKTYVNKRTGEVVDIPDGVDPGWHTNPGKVRGDTLRAVLSERLETVPDELRDVALKDMLDDWAFKKLRAGELGENASAPIGLVPAEVAQRLGLKRRAVWVDGRTAAQADLADEDWAAVQAALGRGEVGDFGDDVLQVAGLRLAAGGDAGQELRLVQAASTADDAPAGEAAKRYTAGHEIVPSLDDGRFAEWADRWAPGARSEEAVRGYVGEDYLPLNAALRGQRELTPEIVEMHAKLLSTIMKHQAPDDLMVHRGQPVTKLPAHPSDIVPGDVIKQEAYVSTSMWPDIAYQFAQGAPRFERLIWRIKLDRGTPVTPASQVEGELLLPPGTELIVESVTKQDVRGLPGMDFYKDRRDEVWLIDAKAKVPTE